MEAFTALVVYGSAEISEQLTRALETLGVAAHATADPREAAARIAREPYGALILDDQLAGGGSLEVFVALEELGEARPPVVMVAVPRELLAQARQAASDRVEYVATPETETEVERLALRVRSRLVNSGLAQEFSSAPLPREGVASARVLSTPSSRDHRPLLAVATVLAILLALFFALQRLPTDGEPVGLSPAFAQYALLTLLERA